MVNKLDDMADTILKRIGMSGDAASKRGVLLALADCADREGMNAFIGERSVSEHTQLGLRTVKLAIALFGFAALVVALVAMVATAKSILGPLDEIEVGINEIINNDYATKGRLERLEVVEWGGFRFQISERLTKTGNNRNALFFMPKAGKLKFSQDVVASMWRLPDRKNIPYIYIKMGFGMTRMWGECMARVSCLES
jgi:hypothetical protein